LDRAGNAYVYGKAFNADGTVRKETFLIDSLSSGHSYTDITVATLSGGETVIAWAMRKGEASDIVLSLLDTQLNKVGDAVTLREIEDKDTLEQVSPKIYGLADGGFGISYKGKFDPGTGEAPYPAFMHTVFSPQGDDLVLARSEAVFATLGTLSSQQPFSTMDLIASHLLPRTAQSLRWPTTRLSLQMSLGQIQ
jgi:hypothetical protein